MIWLWPIMTGVTLVDAWTLAHLGFWCFVGSTLWSFKLNRWHAFYVCLFVAIAWEGFERYAERAWPGRWQDPESWINSWVSDPLTCVIAYWGIHWILDHRPRMRVLT